MPALPKYLVALSSCFILAACDPAAGGPGTPASETSTAPNAQSSGQSADSHPVTVPYCKRSEEKIPNLDVSIGSITPRDLAMSAVSETRGTWKEGQSSDNAAMVKQSISPSANNIGGLVRVAYANGDARLIKNTLIPCTPGAECADYAPNCRDFIEIDMQVTMNSDNGVFAESWTGILSVPDPRDPDNQEVVEPEESAGQPKQPKSGLPKKFQIRTNVEPITFAGTATLQSGQVNPRFKIFRNHLSYTLSFSEKKLTGASIGSFVEVRQHPQPKDGSGIGGAGSQTLYTFTPAP